MTEKEKALAGLLYDASGDTELTAERDRVKDLCLRYNALSSHQQEERRALIGQILGQVGKDCFLTAPFWCDYGYNIHVGDYFYTNHNCVILDCAPVIFGDHVLIGPNCCFSTAGHPLDVCRRNQGLEYAYPITVGSNVWFGANVTVLPGVTIGNNCVIGAGSVVTRDIPAGMVAVGNPCRPLRPVGPEDAAKTSF